MKSIIRTIIVNILLCFCLITTLDGQVKSRGVPFITNFQKSDYDAGTQNWAIIQDENDIIYFANNSGILEFDGSKWQLFQVPNKSIIRSLCLGNDNIIYAGAYNEFGFLETKKNGELAYKSLLPLVPPEYRNCNEIWKIYTIGNDVFFQSFNYLFRLRNGKVEVLLSNKNLQFSFYASSRLFIQENGLGLFSLNDGNYSLVPGGEFFANRMIWSIMEFSSSEILIGTADDGLFLYNGDKIVKWGSDELSNVLIKNRIFSGTAIGDNYFAFGTVQDGLYIANKYGEIVQHINRDCGLQNNTVLSVYTDKNLNLWLGLDNGIDYIQSNSSVSYLYPKKELGTGYTACVHNGALYVGTNQGLFFISGYENKDAMSTIGDYSLVEGTNGQVWDLFEYDGILFCGHDKGSFLIDKNTSLKISDIQGGWKFMNIPGKDNVLLQGTYSGLARFRKSNGIWTFDKIVENFNESCREMEFDDKGNLWIGHSLKGVFSVKFDDRYEEIVSVAFYDSHKGLPSDLSNTVLKFEENVFVSTNKGQYIYNAPKDKIEPSAFLDNIFGNNAINRIYKDNQSRYWYFQDQEVYIAQRKFDGTFRTEMLPFNMLKGSFLPTYEHILFIDQENVILNVEDGFIHFNSMYEKRVINNFPTVVRSVESLSDSLYFIGKSNTNTQLVLKYGNNDIRIRYSAINYESVKKMRYRYMLKGFDEDWSAWENKSYKEYTNLPEGDYTFMVESMDVFNIPGQPATIKLVILPPWFRTKTAWTVYSFVLLTIIFVAFKYFFNRFEKEKTLLEQKQKKEIEDKEKEFEQQKSIAEQEITELKNEKLRIEIEKNKAELENRSKELASAAMQMTYKNEMLNDIKNRLSKVLTKMIHEESKKQINNLVKTLEKDLVQDEDWAKFEIHFDQVHEDFIKKLKEQYPELTPNDLKICAYLRMNLSTKEIAPLLNISVRGVEISRYRLRKKLGLGRDTNLTEFLLEFK